MKIGPGRILGIIGGLLAVVGSFLPWAIISDGTTTLSIMGAIYPIFGWLFVIMAILGLIFVAIPNKILNILAMVWGIIALIMGLLAMVLTSFLGGLGGLTGTITVSNGYGIYLGLVGAVLLMIGSPMAYSEAKKAAAAAMPPMMGPPMPPPQ